jgi:hypothetical protein
VSFPKDYIPRAEELRASNAVVMYTVVRENRKRPSRDRDVGCGVKHGALDACMAHGYSTNGCPSVDEGVRLILGGGKLVRTSLLSLLAKSECPPST